MAKETIATVKKAEEDALALQQNAKAQSEAILSAAEGEKKKILSDMAVTAKAQVKALLDAAEAESKKIDAAAKDEASQEIVALTQSAKQNEDRAIDAVLTRITEG